MISLCPAGVHRMRFAPLLTIALLAACGGDSTSTNPTGVTGAGLHAIEAPDSLGLADASVVKPPSVVLFDASNHGRSGARVTFRIVSGGGVIRDSVVTTDANGRAALGGWTLGPTQTTNIVEASTDGSAPVRFSVAAHWPSQIAGDALGACALVSGHPMCWGTNVHRELGVTLSTIASPLPVAALASVSDPIGELHGSFGNHLCALTTAFVAWCWGRNDFGQAGGNVLNAEGIGPTALARLWSTISPGRITTCAVEFSGSVFCWGSNQQGEIGNPAVLVSIAGAYSTATLVTSTLKFKSVSAGWLHACALTTDGSAYCWGSNTKGQLGIGAIDSIHTTPTRVATDEHFASLSAAGTFTCGITTNQRALCWGQNDYGQLGDGTTITRASPTSVAGDVHFTSISATTFFNTAAPPEMTSAPPGGSPGHVCALTESGKPYCWGWNGWGQLGDGTLQDRTTPVAVLGELSLNGIVGGESFTCGMRKAAVWCWGGNVAGQLGDGTTARHTAPVSVRFP